NRPAAPAGEASRSSYNHPQMPRARIRHAFLVFSIATVVATGQAEGPAAKPFSIGVRRFAFNPARIEVNQDDLVKIDLHTDDIAHSLTIDENGTPNGAA